MVRVGLEDYSAWQYTEEDRERGRERREESTERERERQDKQMGRD